MKLWGLLSILLLISCSTAGKREHNNYPDEIDANNIPAPLEEREEEYINTADQYDRNSTPAIKERREQGEVMKHGEYLNDDEFWE
jgi:hypothetical protein